MGRDNTTIREATESDSTAIAALAGELGYATTSAEMHRRLAALQKSGNDSVLVAMRSGKVAAWIHLSRVMSLESEVFAEIRGFVVTESERGTGVGTELVKAAEAWARERACPKIRVRSNVVRTDTRRFYENRGFVVTKTQNVFDKPLVAGHTSRSGRITNSRSR
ncbi:MAG TPA: GNAT family N-acetyltransferase [Thermoanaerobaculia bacterium]